MDPLNYKNLCNIELEKAVLGTILIEKDSFSKICDFIKPECFYLPIHQEIYSTLVEMTLAGYPLDYISVAQYFQKTKKSTEENILYYLTNITTNIVSGAYIEHHANTLLEYFLKRRLIFTSEEIKGLCGEQDKDIFEILEGAEDKIYSLTTNYLKTDYKDINSLLVPTITHIDKVRENSLSGKLTGISSGYTGIDNVTGGWQKTDLIIIGARPGMGKTTFALNLALNCARISTKAVGFFSLEMNSNQLIMRLLSNISGVNYTKIATGVTNEDEYSMLLNIGTPTLSTYNIYIDDAVTLNLFELRAKAKRMVSKNNVSLIIIDYLQLMQGMIRNNSTNREQEISSISRGLKALAKELSIPIIALSQLSRELEKRGKESRIPVLSDLRESGAIEQDADLVFFIYRSEYYENSSLDKENKGKTIIRIAKNRHGNTADIELYSRLDIQKIENSRITNDNYAF